MINKKKRMMVKKNSYNERDKKKTETKGKMMTNNDRGEKKE